MKFLGISFAVAVVVLTSVAHADEYSSLFFFGDSLTDEGRNGQTAPVMWPSVLRNDISVYQGENFAIGGAITSNQPSAKFGDSSYLGQVNSFISSNQSVSNNSAAGIWIGTNNITINSAAKQAPSTVAANASADVATGIKELVAAGVHNIILLGVYDVSMSNALEGTGLGIQLNAAAASAQFNAQLAALNVSGANIQYFNIAAFINHLQSNPYAYGFSQILPLQLGAVCNAVCQQTSIFSDIIHLTAKAQTLLGNYIASGDPIYNGANVTYGAIATNLASSSASAPIPADMSRAAAANFVAAMFSRLDAERSLPPQRASDGQGRSASQPIEINPWSVFAFGDALGSRLGPVGNSIGYQPELDLTVTGATGGLQYRFSPETRFGAAFNFAHAVSDLSQSIGTKTNIEAYQGALYASVSYPHWFVDAITTIGGAGFNQTRQGIFGNVSSSANSGLFTSSGRGGYLFEFGMVQVGPTLGLSYSRVWIPGYKETGDLLYAAGFASQRSDGLMGSDGLEVRLAEADALWPFSPYGRLTYEHQFLRNAQPISSYLAGLPTQALPLSYVSAGVDDVKLELGSYLNIGQGWGSTLSAFGLRGLRDTYACGTNVGLNYRF